MGEVMVVEVEKENQFEFVDYIDPIYQITKLLSDWEEEIQNENH